MTTDITIGPAPAANFADMGLESFGLWKQHPVTRAFFAYLGDQAEEWERQFVASWKHGVFRFTDNESIAHQEFLRGQVRAFCDLAEIRLEQLQEFYAVAEQAEDDS